MGIVLAGLAVSVPARAQIQGLEQWAEAIVNAQTAHWAGQRTPWPEHVERPGADAIVLRSVLRPLSVHAAAGVPFDTAERALAAMEAAYDWTRAEKWGVPMPDASVGGTSGLDLYLVPGASVESAGYGDASVPWAFLDAMSSFAVVDPDVEPDLLDACVTSAYVQAMLLGQDPAEASAWRRATGDFVAWLLTGHFGTGAGVERQQREPWRAWVAQEGDGAGGALLLAMISARADGGSGRFVRDVWQLARQRTWEGLELRGAPDLWMAFKKALELAHQSLEDFIEEVAVARWFVGDPARAAQAPFALLRSLPPTASVPVVGRTEWARLPKHLPLADPPVEPYGSGYGVIDVRAAPLGSQMRIWLDGEFGVQWSLVAMRLDANGREISRLTAPATRNPRVYLVLELATGTAEVVLIATNFSERLPDADVPDEHMRMFEFVAGR